MAWRAISANARAIAGTAWSSCRVAVVSIAGSWTLYLSFVATRLAIIGFPHEVLLMHRHLLSASTGAGLTALLYLVLRRLEHAPIALRIAAALLLAVPAAGFLTVVNFEFLYVLAPHAIWAHAHHVHVLRGIFARTILEIYLAFAGWGALYTSVSSAIESKEAQRLAALLQAETKAAQLQALRYQLNPHFLFNALNTVSALVMRGDAEGAEHTIQALSAFLRSALAPEAMDDATLAEEIALQRLYLEIEQVRFGNRLRVRWSVPDRLQPALLPPLLLQPLVENVIRHAVAPTHKTVTMNVGAFAEDDHLHLLVEDDGTGSGMPSTHGIGLRNAAARLSTRYGEAARCLHGPRPGGGFRVELVLPLHLRSAGG
jgi:two-component system, LytTR family, sensor kinase